MPGSGCRTEIGRLGQSGLLSGEVAHQVEPLEPPSAGQALCAVHKRMATLHPACQSQNPDRRPRPANPNDQMKGKSPWPCYIPVPLNGRRHRGLFWYYQAPFQEVAAVKGYLAPYNERVDLIVDGHLQDRPAGPFGPPAEPSTPAA